MSLRDAANAPLLKEKPGFERDESSTERQPGYNSRRTASVPPMQRSSACRTLLAFAAWTCLLSLVLLRRPNHGIDANVSQNSCSALAFDSGTWVRKRYPPTSLPELEDVHAAFNVSGCRAGYDPLWNIGLHLPPPYDYRIPSMSYEWDLHPICQIRDLTMRQKLQILVDDPLLIAGDSRTRQQFFALSCDLNDHTVWKGAAAKDEHDKTWYFEPQHLLLDPRSPLVGGLRLPATFSFEKPLVSYASAYTPLSRSELKGLEGVRPSLLPSGDMARVAPYDKPMNDTVNIFIGPASHYKAMIFSFGAHFSPSFLVNPSVSDAVSVARKGIRSYIEHLQRGMRPDQRVFVRAAEAGQANCDAYHEALEEVGDQGDWWNYRYIPDINKGIQIEAELSGDARFTWLGLDRITRLRPDAHLQGDCLHIAVGTGVFEAINRYIWHSLAVAAP